MDEAFMLYFCCIMKLTIALSCFTGPSETLCRTLVIDLDGGGITVSYSFTTLFYWHRQGGSYFILKENLFICFNKSHTLLLSSLATQSSGFGISLTTATDTLTVFILTQLKSVSLPQDRSPKQEKREGKIVNNGN